jgi:hypothetical protein
MSSALALAVVPRTAEFGVTFLDDGGERSGSLSELWNVRFERVSPVREFPTFRGQRNSPGSWWSATTGGHVHADPQRKDVRTVLLSWLYLILGWLIIATYSVVWTRANQGQLMRRNQSSPVSPPPRWSYIILALGIFVGLFGASDLQGEPIEWWAPVIFVVGAVIAQTIPVALHNRSVRRTAQDPHS